MCDKCDRAQITMTCAVKNICIKEGEVCMPQKVCVAISSIILLHKFSNKCGQQCCTIQWISMYVG